MDIGIPSCRALLTALYLYIRYFGKLTQKSGKIIHFNISENTKKEISHNLNFLEIGQGGLLDIKNYNNKLFICYTEKRVGGTSTSIASGFLKSNNIVFKNIFRDATFGSFKR